jgi:hypothetical protein
VKRTVFSGTGFSLCSFDFSVAQIKTTQAEACATENLHHQNRNAAQIDRLSQENYSITCETCGLKPFAIQRLFPAKDISMQPGKSGRQELRAKTDSS